MSTEQSIDSFLKYCRKYLEDVRLNTRQCSPLVPKLAYVALLDAISTASYPCIKREGPAFTKFLNDFCALKNADRVSLPWLLYVINQAQNKEDFDEVADLARNRVETWRVSEDEGVSLENDPTIEEIEAQWPRRQNKLKRIKNPNGDMIPPRQLTHASIAWQERNFLVHQLTCVGVTYTPRFKEDEPQPYYSWETGRRRHQGQWVLIYPLDFLHDLCETSVNGWKLEAYLRRNQIDPRKALKSRRRLMV
jgi:hypothetical protein